MVCCTLDYDEGSGKDAPGVFRVIMVVLEKGFFKFLPNKLVSEVCVWWVDFVGLRASSVLGGICGK